MAWYQKAERRPSTIPHGRRSVTWGICFHNTYGAEAGDRATLDGPGVDCHLYFTKDGDVVQFVDTDSPTWTAYSLANATCLHFEVEGKRSEPWTEAQTRNIVEATKWAAKLYGIPLVKVDPEDLTGRTWRGLFDHRDLAGINGNNHTDGVPPSGPGWVKFLSLVNAKQEAQQVKPTLAQRLRAAGFGQRSIDQIIAALRKGK